jgi:antitoxin ParD1/3/4
LDVPWCILRAAAQSRTKHISLPESLIDSYAEEGEFDNASDYVRSLIRTDVRQREEEKLERMLLEGVRSGRGIEVGSKEWKEFRKKLSASVHTKQLKQQV